MTVLQNFTIRTYICDGNNFSSQLLGVGSAVL